MQDFPDTIQVERQPYIAHGLDQQGRYPEALDDHIDDLAIAEGVIRGLIWVGVFVSIVFVFFL